MPSRPGITAFCTLALALGLAFAPAVAAEPDRVPGEVVVRFRPGTAPSVRDRIQSELGSLAWRDLGASDAVCLTLREADVEGAIAKYWNDPAIACIEPNYRWRLDALRDGSSLAASPEAWGTGGPDEVVAEAIAAGRAPAAPAGDGAVIVAILDTGIDVSHPDLAANIWTNPGEVPANGIDDDHNGFVDDVHGYDFVNRDGDPRDDLGHGTHCAGIVDATGTSGSAGAGIAWDAQLMAVKFMDRWGYGSTANAIAALNYATRMGARVVSCSWGGAHYSQSLADAIEAAGERGVLFVSSAGGASTDIDLYPHYPPSFPADNLIAVTAATDTGELASFANWGATSVDLAAPGVQVLSTLPGGTYGRLDGSTAACPHVSGALAVLLRRLPGLSGPQARQILLRNVQPQPALQGRIATGGVLDLGRMLADADASAPDAIVDLRVAGIGGQWVDLAWTATGDDGAVGAAAEYELRYATVPLDSLNFTTGTLVPGLPAPSAAGAAESCRVAGLAFDSAYWFAVRARDEHGQASRLAGAISARTAAPPVATIAPAGPIAASLGTGTQATRSLTVTNTGVDELTWALEAQGSRPWAPRILLLTDNYATSAFQAALTRRQMSATSAYDWSGLTSYLMYYATNWDLVIIDRYDGAPGTTATAALLRHVDAGGALIIGDAAMSVYAGHPLLARLGVEYRSSLAEPRNVVAVSPDHGIFRRPNVVSRLNWDASPMPIDGQVVATLPGARVLAAFEGEPEAPAVVMSANGRTIFNAFQTGSYHADDDNDGVRDAIELAENELAMVAMPGRWLRAEPDHGALAAGESDTVSVTLDASRLCGMTPTGSLVVRTNDPARPEIQVAASLSASTGPDVSVAPSRLSFGTSWIGVATTAQLLVRNDGCQPLTITSITSDRADFACTFTSPYTITAGQRLLLNVRFTPATVGDMWGTLTLLCSDPDEGQVIVPVEGTGAIPPHLVATPDSISAQMTPDARESRPLVLANTGGANLEWSAKIYHGRGAQVYRLASPAPVDADVPADSSGNEDLVVELASLVGRRILWDMGHGEPESSQYSIVLNDLYARGATAVHSSVALTPGLLASYDALWIGETYTALTSTEVAAVTEWVRRGGAVMLLGDRSPAHFNALLAAMDIGMGCSGTSSAGRTTILQQHAVTSGVRIVQLRGATSAIEVSPPATSLVRDVYNKPVMACSRLGNGRVIVVTDDMLRYSDYYLADNRLLANQAVDWLLGANWLELSPAAGTVAPGATQEVTAIFSSDDLCQSDGTAEIRFYGNDPAQPRPFVTASLQVDGPADISIDRGQIDFGTPYIGASATATVVLANDGCGTLTVTGVASDRGEFTPSSPGPLVLKPGERLPLDVTFAPTMAGPLTGHLTLASDDPDEPLLVVQLDGVGVEPPVVAVSPDSLAADLEPGGLARQVLTITNVGQDVLDWSLAFRPDSALRETVLPPLTAVAAPDDEVAGAADGAPSLAEVTLLLADVRGLRIVWDRSHGEEAQTGYSALWSELASRGAIVSVNLEPLTPAILATCDVLWVRETTTAFSAPELAALSEWVRGGGGLLLEGNSSTARFNAILDALGAGITFGGPLSGGRMTNILPHPTTAGVTALYTYYQGASLAVAAPQAGSLAEDSFRRPIAAWSRVERGRVIALGFDSLYNYAITQESNRTFGHQVMDWLSGAYWLEPQPATGRLPAGTGQDVEIVFTAHGLCGADLAGSLVVSSNDPLRPGLAVPATLSVTGSPGIIVSADSLAFGTRWAGIAVTDTIKVGNGGCEALSITEIASSNPEFTPGLAGPLSLPPRTVVAVPVTYLPGTEGAITGALTIASTDPATPLVSLPLSGAGLRPPAFTVAPDSFLSSLLPGRSEQRSLQIGNEGHSPLHWTVSQIRDSGLREFRLPAPDTTLPAPPDSAGAGAGATAGTSPDPGREQDVGELVVPLLDLSGVRIIWDNAHGQASSTGYSTMLSELRARGAEIIENTLPLTSQSLASADMLWLRETTYWFTAAEATAVANWVNGGGGLLLEGDDSPARFNGVLTAVAAGITFGGSAGAGTTTNLFFQHRTTMDVASLYLPAPSTGISAVVAPASVLAVDSSYRNVAAWSRVADGRVVAVCDDVFANSTVLREGNRRFGHQVVDWLAGSAWLSVEPRSGTLMPGESESLAVSFDAGLWCDTTLDQWLRFGTNDPLRTQVDVAATLTVAGSPELELSAREIEFGSRILGIAATVVLQVRNDGCRRLNIGNITSDHGDFIISSDVPSVIEAYRSADIAVVFRPSTVGPIFGALTVTCSDPDEQVATVALRGVGVPRPNIVVAPDSLVAALPSGQARSQVLTIANTGHSDLGWTLTTAYRPVDGAAAADKATPRTLVFYNGASGRDAHAQALQNLGWPYEYRTLWSAFISDLVGNGPWDLVVVNNVTLTPTTGDLDALLAHVDGGGALVYADFIAHVNITHELFNRLGVGAIYVNSVPKTIRILDVDHPCFTSPRRVGDIVPATDLHNPCGQLAQARAGARGLATIDSYTNRFIILQGSTGRTVFNGFAVDDYTKDSDGDGMSDMTELAMNELMLVTQPVGWLSAEPRSGIIAAGDSQRVNVTFDASATCGGTYGGRLDIASNDPVHPLVQVPALISVTGHGDVEVLPAGLTFPARFVGLGAVDSVSIRNVGCAPLTVTSLATSRPEFVLSTTGPFTLAPLKRRTVAVWCMPSTVGDVTGSLVIVSDDPDVPELSLPLAGVGLAPPVCELSPAGIDLALAAGGQAAAEVTITNRGLAPLAWSVAEAASGPGAPRVLVLVDPGASVFRVALTRLALAHTTTTTWASFDSALRTNGPWDLVIVQCGGTATAPMTALDALNAHVKSGRALIYGPNEFASHAGHPLLATLGVRYGGDMGSLGFAATDTASSLFRVPNRVTRWEWTGSVIVGQSRLITTTGDSRALAALDGCPQSAAIAAPAGLRALVNAFNASSHAGNVDGDGLIDMVELAENEIAWLGFSDRWLTVAPSSGLVQPGASQAVTMGVDASALCGGRLEETLVFDTNDPQRPRVQVAVAAQVRGEPRATALPGHLAFGQQYVGERRTLDLVLANDGCDTLQVQALVMSQAAYSLDGPATLALPPGAESPLRVAFTPPGVGTFPGFLTITSNDPSRPELVVPLTGAGLAPPQVVVSPDSLHLQALPGHETSRTVTLGNTGASPLAWYAAEAAPALDAAARWSWLPRVLVFGPGPRTENAFALAAQRLGLPHEYVETWATFDQALIYRGPWDLIVVENYNDYLGTSAGRLTTLNGLDCGLIFADNRLDLDNADALRARLGVVFDTSFERPRNLAPVDRRHPCFTTPNDVPPLRWSVDRMTRDGQTVTSAHGSPQYLAGFAEGQGMAIVYRPESRTLFNAFQSANYRLDDDRDGVADMVELAENEIALMAFDSDWLSWEPFAGTLAPGATVDVTVRAVARGDCRDTAHSALVLHSNDPLAPAGSLRVAMDVAGAALGVLGAPTLAFGPQYLDISRRETIDVANTGCTELVVTSVVVEGAGYRCPDLVPFAVAAGGHRAVTIEFTPPGTGDLAGTVTLTTDSGLTPVLTAALTGQGIEAPVMEVTAPTLSVTLPINGRAARQITIANRGRGRLEWSTTVRHAGSAMVLDQSPEFAGETGPGKAIAAKDDAAPADGARPAGASYESAPSASSLPAASPAGSAMALEDVLDRLDVGHVSITSVVPNRFDFNEGVTGNLISDGGGDMFDAGNVFYTSLGGPVSYSDGIIDLESLFGEDSRCFTRKYPGLFVLVADLNEVASFRVTGHLGADGSGRVDGAVLGMEVRDNPRHLGFVKRVYGAGDPSVNHLIIVEERPGTGHYFPLDTDLDYHEVTGLQGHTRLYYLLFASADGGYVNNATMFDVMRSFLAVIGATTPLVRCVPASGLLEPGESLEATVEFDAITMDAGDYQADLVLGGNDPRRPVVELPVQVRVLAAPGALSLTLDVSQGSLAADPLLLGVDASATDGFDVNRDLPAGEPPPGSLAAWFPHPEWTVAGTDRFRTDQRASFDLESGHKTWPLVVEATGAGTVTIAATAATPLPLGTRVLLLDPVANTELDLLGGAACELPFNGPGTRSYLVRVGRDLPGAAPADRALAAGWSLVGLSTVPPVGATLFDALLGQAPQGSWLYAWRPATGTYDVLSPNAPGQVAQGMWLYAPQPFTWSAPGARMLGDLQVPLAEGWSLVGYPLWFPGSLSDATVERGGVRFTFDQAVSAGFVAPVAFGLAPGGAYEAVTQLDPWRAYWVATYVEGAALCFDHRTMEAEPGAASAQLAGTALAAEWSLAVRVAGANAAGGIRLGCANGARDGYDPAFDLPAPPAAPGAEGVSLTLPRPEWVRVRDLSFASDIRAAGSDNLAFTAELRGPAGPCRLAWDVNDLQSAPDLEMRVNGRTVVASLREQGSVELMLTGSPLALEFAPAVPSESAWLAAGGARLRNRPNPFNPATSVCFELPRSGQVDVAIYDTSGRLVRRLGGGRLPRGASELEWDGRDGRGQPAQSGVYLYRLLLDGRQLGGTRKMTLLK